MQPASTALMSRVPNFFIKMTPLMFRFFSCMQAFFAYPHDLNT